MPSIEQDIQSTAFSSAAHKAQVNIIYTAHWINQQTAQRLKPYGLSLQQFNILRILRGRGKEPSTIKLLTERMLDKMSNASRLVDKLKEKGLVSRKECPDDRRRVDILITDAGLRLLSEASAAIDRQTEGIERYLSPSEAEEISRLLDKLRG